jgi:hypothetical protein
MRKHLFSLVLAALCIFSFSLAKGVPLETPDCAQPGAEYLNSTCKIDQRCDSGCEIDEFQLIYPACTCFDADFGGSLVLVSGNSFRIEEHGTGQVRTGWEQYAGDGDKISTSGSVALMVLPEGAFFRLAPNSEVEVDAEGLFFNKGECWANVKGNENRLYVKMETISAGAKGTAFYAWNNEDEEGIRAIEGTVFVRITNPGTGAPYTMELPAGSEVVFDRSRNEVQVFEGDGQTLTLEYEEFVESSENMLVVYGNRGENDLFCTPALFLLAALLPAALLRR